MPAVNHTNSETPPAVSVNSGNGGNGGGGIATRFSPSGCTGTNCTNVEGDEDGWYFHDNGNASLVAVMIAVS